MQRGYLCIGCDGPIHWFCADGNSTENESKGHVKKYWCPPCFLQQIMMTQDKADATENEDNVMEIDNAVLFTPSPQVQRKKICLLSLKTPQAVA